MHSSTHSSYLFIEKHHSISNSVTVYDPHHGIQIRQISSLVCYKVNTLIFKRSSYRSLVCPNLLQRFALVSPASPPSSTYSPYCIISLFDGSGSFSDVIANAVGTWPHPILAAEMDAGTRSVVSKVKGWSVEGCGSGPGGKITHIPSTLSTFGHRAKLPPVATIHLLIA